MPKTDKLPTATNTNSQKNAEKHDLKVTCSTLVQQELLGLMIQCLMHFGFQKPLSSGSSVWVTPYHESNSTIRKALLFSHFWEDQSQSELQL